MTSLPQRVPARVIIEGVEPQIDGGRFAIKRTVAEEVVVGADIFTDGHEILAARLRYRHTGASDWSETALREQPNDRWTARFVVSELGQYEYTLQAWIDQFATWRQQLSKRLAAGQDVASELLAGAALVRAVAENVAGPDGDWLNEQAGRMAGQGSPAFRSQAALDETLAALMTRHADRSHGVIYERVLRVTVDRERARFGAWYELFPRSCADEPGRHGTFKDVEARLPYVAEMGFDVLYLPPVHPIGESFRKGPNNSLTAGPNDPGSPWAIGAPAGGHTAIHPALGTLADFDRLLAAAQAHGIELAMDIAFQCSPDHPYVREHPEWFRHRPDGTIKYAENPPKKYQDIYPLDFEGTAWHALWQELLEVLMFWGSRGVRIFRIDNPHTKPFHFWEWIIGKAKERYPDLIFLSEAFTRPKPMKYLAKSGFTQSYTYFTWRNTKHELTTYFTEMTQSGAREYLRPNLFANTPDILPEYLQHSGPNGFRIRLVLAATLGASYGIYGPPFERCLSKAVPDKEEYLDSEKFEVHHWPWNEPNVFREFISVVNRIRRENPALHFDHGLRFYPVDNERLLFYAKALPDLSNIVMVIVNLDPHHTQSGWVHVPLDDFGLGRDQPYQVHDLVTGAHYLWYGEANFVELEPSAPAHILRVRKRVRSERDFDYFL